MFEYQILRADGFVSVEQLNKLGVDGWELVSIITDEDGYDYIFKKFIGPIGGVFQKFQVKKEPTLNAIIEAFKNADTI